MLRWRRTWHSVGRARVCRWSYLNGLSGLHEGYVEALYLGAGSFGLPYLIVQMGTWPRTYSFPSHGVPQICRYAYGVPSNITHAPTSRTEFGRPSRAASYSQRIIQCGPIGIGGLVLSEESVLLCCVAP